MKSFKVVSLTILFVVSLLKNSVPDLTKYTVILCCKISISLVEGLY